MDNEPLACAVAAMTDVFNAQYAVGAPPLKWFVSFGSLLYLCRDKLVGLPYETGDIDISVFQDDLDGEDLVRNMNQYGYALKTKVMDNTNGKPFQMVFSPKAEMFHLPQNMDVDVFFWVKANGFYWHTYDFNKEGGETLSEYVFKGIPCRIFDGGIMPAIWDALAPPVNIPIECGACLDTWYPPKRDALGVPVMGSAWFIPDKRYGWSAMKWVKRLKTCANLQENLKLD